MTEDFEEDSVPVVSFNLEETFLGEGRYKLGLILAIMSTIFIGSSFIIKKMGLIRLSSRGLLRAGDGGFGYLKEWIWWGGFLCMGFGELFNFVAYAFAPAALVTPLGALSVLVTAVLARKFLKEKLGILGIIGCINCIFGSTIIVLHAPKEGQVKSLVQLRQMMSEPIFVIYLVIVMILCFILIAFMSPKYGNRNILVHITICSLIGSLSVISCKGIGIAMTETIAGTENDFRDGLFWFLLISTVITIAVQMNYLNKSLDVFDASLVTPIYYVMFTSLVLLGSAILFEEWKHIEFEDYVGSFSGFIIVVTGISLINFFKDTKVKYSRLNHPYSTGSKLNPYRSLRNRSNSMILNPDGSTSVPKQTRKKRKRNSIKNNIRRQNSDGASSETSSDETFTLVKP